MRAEEKVLKAITSKTLDNGFKLIMAPIRSHPVVSLQLYVKMGSCWEKEDESGYSHFLEHLVFKSTRKYPDNKLTEKAMYMGSSMNAYTEFDSTCYYLTLSSQFLEEGIELLAELSRYPNFSQSDFQYEKNVVLEEIAYYENDPEDYFLERIPQLYFHKSPFKKPIIGSKESILKASRQGLFDFWKRNYTPSNCFLVVSGDFDNNAVIKEAEKLFGDWESGEIKTREKQHTVYPQQMVVESIDKQVVKPLLAFTYPELSHTDPRSHCLDIISKIFAEGKKSRLYKRLFLKEKLVDQIKVESCNGINDGFSVIIINPVRSNDIKDILTVFLDEYAQLRNLQPKEMDEAKAEMVYAHRYALEYAKGIGFSLGVEEVMGDYRNFARYFEIVKNMSYEDIERMINYGYRLDRLGIFTLGPGLDTSQMQDMVSGSINNVGSHYPAISSAFQYTQQEGAGPEGDFQKSQLSNGTTLMMKKVTGKPTVGITAAFNVSQLNEQPENRGINYLTSALLLYGNEKQSFEQVLEFCSKYGILLNISAADDVTLIRLKCFEDNLYTALELLENIITAPTFPQEHFFNLQKTIVSNLDRMKDYPVQHAAILWKKMVFGNDSNLIDREGTKSTVRSLSRKKVVNWFRKYYRIPEMTISIVGDISFRDFAAYCNRVFSDYHSEWFGDYPQTGCKDSSNIREGQVKLREEKKSSSSSQQSGTLQMNNSVKYNVAFPYPSKDNQERLTLKKSTSPVNNGAIIHLGGYCCSAAETDKNTAIHLLSQVLGGDINSRLFQELREKRGLAYNVGFAVNAMQHLGYYAAFAIVDKKNARQAIDLIIDCFRQIIDEGVTEEELTIAKNSIRGQRLRSEESVDAQASMLAALDKLGYDYNYYLQREARLQRITTRQVQQVAQEYLRKENLYVHLLM